MYYLAKVSTNNIFTVSLPTNTKFLAKDVFETRVKQSLYWLARSIDATGQRGSAGYYHLWRGWSAAYPETTGYLVETLMEYAAYFGETRWTDLAIGCTDWLCSIQRPDGAFPGGLGEYGEPVVFDTGQILFGLIAAWRHTGKEKYRSAMLKATDWLMVHLDADGLWRGHAYVPGYVPAYYTRVVWAVLAANEILQKPEITARMRQAAFFYTEWIQPNGAVRNWGFAPDEPAYTHTIAYTLRGWLECGILLSEQYLAQTAQQVAEAILAVYNQKGSLAGRYDEGWQGDYRFVCVTGNAQLAIVFARLFQTTGEPQYLALAQAIFKQTIDYQWRVPRVNLRGAIPGSVPLWGVYQRFAFPNWAAKFYLDAYLLLHRLHSTQNY